MIPPPEGVAGGEASGGTDVAGNARKGLAITFAGQAVKLSAQFGATIILARLLGPAEMGVVGMAVPVAGLLMALVMNSFSAYAIQADELDSDALSTVFWMSSLTGLGLTAIGVLVSPLAAAFYGVEDVQYYLAVLSFSALAQGVMAAPQARLARSLSWRRLMVAESGGLLLAAVGAIAAAWRGAGPWSMVVLQLGGVSLHAVLVWLLSGWRPGWVWHQETARQAFVFGRELTLFNLINYIGRNGDDILVGWWLGEYALGLYMLAYRLLLVPSRMVMVPVTRVAVASLSRLRNDQHRWSQHYLELVTFTMATSAPLVMLLRHLAEDLIAVVLGAEWLPAASVFAPLSVVAVVHSAYTTFGWIWISMGQADRMRTWAVIAIPITLAALAAGIPWGIDGVAWGYATVNLALFLPGLVYAVRGNSLTVPRFLGELVRPLTLFAVIEVVMLAFTFAWPVAGLDRLLVGSVGLGVVAVTTIWFLWGNRPFHVAMSALGGIVRWRR